MLLFFAADNTTQSVTLTAHSRLENGADIEHTLSLQSGEFFGGVSYDVLKAKSRGTIELDEKTQQARILDLIDNKDKKLVQDWGGP